MKIGLIADTHIRETKNFTNYFNLLKSTLNYFIELCYEKKVEKVYILGDFFHTKNTIDTEALISVAFDFIEKLEKNFKIVILVGNHDSIYKEHDINLVRIFRKNNIKVIEQVSQHKYEKENHIFVPYYTGEMLEEKLSSIKLDKQKTNYLFGHFGINDFFYKLYNKTNEEKIDSNYKLFSQVKYAFLGHIHAYQQKDNVISISSPMQHRKGDEEYDHGFVFLDTEKEQFEFVENIYSPKFKTLYLNKTNWNEILNSTNTFLNIILSKKVNIRELNELKKELEKKNNIVEFTNEYLKNNIVSSNLEIGKMTKVSPGRIIKEYVSESVTKYNQEEFLKILFEE